jgi:hypothetical protein
MNLQISDNNGRITDRREFVIPDVNPEQYWNGLFLNLHNDRELVSVELTNDEAMALIIQLSNGIRENLRHL